VIFELSEDERAGPVDVPGATLCALEPVKNGAIAASARRAATNKKVNKLRLLFMFHFSARKEFGGKS
jgi:hypothetical protein